MAVWGIFGPVCLTFIFKFKNQILILKKCKVSCETPHLSLDKEADSGELQNLPVRAYLDKTVVPILL